METLSTVEQRTETFISTVRTAAALLGHVARLQHKGVCTCKAKKPHFGMAVFKHSRWKHVNLVEGRMPIVILKNNRERQVLERKATIDIYQTTAKSAPEERMRESVRSSSGVVQSFLDEVKKATAEWLAKPGPMIIDVRVSRSVVTLPYRRVHYGEDV